MDFPFGLRSGGSIFSAPRARDGEGTLYDCHRGIDLFPKGTITPHPNDSIYAVNWGTIEYLTNHNGPDEQGDWKS
jgi:hypothetical protein